MKKLILLGAVMILSGCAAMFDGTQETITIRSEDKETKIYVNEDYVGKGSAAVTIPKKKLKNTIIRASKEGCADTVRSLETKVDGVSFLGCLIDFCIVSVGIIDIAATGAFNEAAQTSYIVTPVCTK